jgi:nucleotidyltransferase AbiEii toxin of type IV toxin-antitoxin system
VLIRFACERILYRLSISRYRDRFLLKGAMLLPVWSEEAYRLTRDLDLAGGDEISPERVATIFRDLCQIQSRGDGLSFDSDSVRADRIRGVQQEGGLRVEMRASPDGLYRLIAVPEGAPTNQRAEIEAQKIGRMFGHLLTTGTNRPRLLEDSDLILLATCLNPYDLPGALAAELDIPSLFG